MSDKMTVIENNNLFTNLSLDEQESLSGGGILGDAWDTVKKAVKKSLPAVLTAGAIAGLAIFSGGEPTGGSTNGGYWGGGKWKY